MNFNDNLNYFQYFPGNVFFTLINNLYYNTSSDNSLNECIINVLISECRCKWVDLVH